MDGNRDSNAIDLEVEINDLLKDHQMFHSNLQMDHFITIKSGITTYGMYKQALRELYSRYNSIKTEYISMIALRKWLDFYDKHPILKRLKKTKYFEKALEYEYGEKAFRDRIRELARFFEQAKALKKQLGDFTEEERNKHEEEFWYYRMKAMLAVELATTGSVRPNTYEIVMSLPKKDRKELCEELKNPMNMVKWLRDYDHNLPTVEVTKQVEEDMEKLLK